MTRIARMHVVDDSYEDTADVSTWRCVAPHHMFLQPMDYWEDRPERTLYLSFKNDAARRIALNGAGEIHKSAVVHFGIDHWRALAYTEDNDCRIAIL